MGWKNLHYWLKGGITFGIIHLFLLIVAIFKHYSAEMDTSMFVILIDFPIFAISGLFVATSWLENFSNLFLFFGLFGTLMYFCVGALIGYVYEKIKNKSSSNLQ